MKKILALVLALALVLTAVSAFAEASKTNVNIPVVEDNAPEVEVLLPEEEIPAVAAVVESLKAAADAGDVLSALPEEIRAALPEDQKTINEIAPIQFIGKEEKVKHDLVVKIKFTTLYTPGEKVTVLLARVTVDPIKWFAFEGTVQEDGSVQFVVPADTVKTFLNEDMAIAVVSA